MNDKLMRQYLWMDAMNSAVNMAIRHAKPHVYPDEDFHEWKLIDFEIWQRTCLEYALEHWYRPIYTGSFSGHDKFSVGWRIEMDSKGVTNKYKDIEILITWDRVKRFIQDLIDWHPDDAQLTMFEFLTQEAINDH